MENDTNSFIINNHSIASHFYNDVENYVESIENKNQYATRIYIIS